MLKVFSEKNNLFLESIEKYVEIFNEHNVKELNQLNNSEKEIFAEKHLKAIKNETKATTRCRPVDQEKSNGTCIYCGKPAEYKTYFAKAY